MGTTGREALRNELYALANAEFASQQTLIEKLTERRSREIYFLAYEDACEADAGIVKSNSRWRRRNLATVKDKLTQVITLLRVYHGHLNGV
jgi:hypothetical protein